jgi:arylsulfatase A-like enzyme
MSIFDPHDPYSDFPIEMRERVDESILPRPYFSEYESHGKPEAILREHDHSYLGSFHRYSKEELMRMRLGYFASIAFIDQEVGRVLDTLEGQGLAENTLVIFVSDHGDMLGDHELLAKGAFFYDPCTKVPLIMRLPAAVEAGTRSQELVQPHDLAATVLSYAGFSPEEIGEIMPESIDLVSMLRRNNGQSPRDHAVCQYRATSICDEKLYWDPPINATMYRDRRFKLNVYHGERGTGKVTEGMQGELFDMEADPMETNNLWDDPSCAEVKLGMIGRLLDWFVDTDRVVHGSRGGEVFPPKTQWSLNNPL